MKRFALVAVLLAVLCVAPFAVRAEDAPEPTLYVQVEFYSTLNGDADAEALAAWNSFVAEVNKIQGCISETKPRSRKTENDSFYAMLNQPRLTTEQITTLTVEVGKLLDAPCFKQANFSMKLSRTPIAINRHWLDAGKPKTSIPLPR